MPIKPSDSPAGTTRHRLRLTPRASTARFPLSIVMERGLGGEVIAHTTIYNTAICI